MAYKIQGQSYKSEFNSSLGYSEDLRTLFQEALNLRVHIAKGGWNLVPALQGTLGGVVSILRMVTTNPGEKENLKKNYDILRDSVRIEFRKINAGKETIKFKVIDDLEAFQDYLMQQTQNVGLGFALRKQLSKTEKMKRAFDKG